MNKFFLAIYRFFKRRKPLMYLIIAIITLGFAYLGSRLRFEENLLKLFPLDNEESEIAFENLKVKDKVFVQVTGRDEVLGTEDLAYLMDEYMDGLLARDEKTGYIGSWLYRLEDDMMINGLEFAMAHVPSFVDTSCYSAFDKALEPKAIAAQMKKNKAMMAADETGDITKMVTSDPLGLLPIIGNTLLGGKGLEAAGGLTIADGHLFCADSTVAIAFLNPNFNSLDSGTGTKLTTMFEDEIEAFEQAHPEAQVLFHGNVVASTNHSRRIKKDLTLTVGISLILIIIILLVSFRNGRFLWQNVIPIIFGAIAAMACMYLTKGQMSLMALGVSAIILGIGFSYCMHVTIHFTYVQSPAAVLRDESVAVCMGCITTVGAFLGLIFTESELLKDFGLFATFMLVFSTLFALVFLPPMLKPGKVAYNRTVFRGIDKLSAYPFDQKGWLIAAVVIFVGIGIWFSPRVEFDNDMRNLDYVHPSVAKSLSLYEEKNNNGYYQLYFAAIGDTADEAVMGGRRMNRRLDSLVATGDVASYSGMVSELYCTMPEQEQRIAAWKEYWTPEKVNTTMAKIGAAALANGLHPRIFEPFKAIATASYEPADLYDSGVIPESLMSNFIEKGDDGKFMAFNSIYVVKEKQDKPTREITSLPHTIVLDPFWYCRDIVSVVHSDFNTALLISSILVFVILLLSFRNLWIALIAFMPMCLSWYVVEGMMALLGIKFNLINIVISTFIFGVGVDYSIFVMQGLLKEVRDGDKNLLAYHKTAIFFSALVLIIVVMSLIFAKHPAIQSIGTSTLIGMVTTIAITYTLEPWLFRKLLKVPFFSRSFLGKKFI
ncbi:MAG: MMPL family transporter [Bacteroidales bacterium]|nr:MMPL family transporter [Bacteroidales bacterium]